MAKIGAKSNDESIPYGYPVKEEYIGWVKCNLNQV